MTVRRQSAATRRLCRLCRHRFHLVIMAYPFPIPAQKEAGKDGNGERPPPISATRLTQGVPWLCVPPLRKICFCRLLSLLNMDVFPSPCQSATKRPRGLPTNLPPGRYPQITRRVVRGRHRRRFGESARSPPVRAPSSPRRKASRRVATWPSRRRSTSSPSTPAQECGEDQPVTGSGTGGEDGQVPEQEIAERPQEQARRNRPGAGKISIKKTGCAMNHTRVRAQKNGLRTASTGVAPTKAHRCRTPSPAHVARDFLR